MQHSITENPYLKPCLPKEIKSFEMNSFNEGLGYFLLFLKLSLWQKSFSVEQSLMSDH